MIAEIKKVTAKYLSEHPDLTPYPDTLNEERLFSTIYTQFINMMKFEKIEDPNNYNECLQQLRNDLIYDIEHDKSDNYEGKFEILSIKDIEYDGYAADIKIRIKFYNDFIITFPEHIGLRLVH